MLKTDKQDHTLGKAPPSSPLTTTLHKAHKEVHSRKEVLSQALPFALVTLSPAIIQCPCGLSSKPSTATLSFSDVYITMPAKT